MSLKRARLGGHILVESEEGLVIPTSTLHLGTTQLRGKAPICRPCHHLPLVWVEEGGEKEGVPHTQGMRNSGTGMLPPNWLFTLIPWGGLV